MSGLWSWYNSNSSYLGPKKEIWPLARISLPFEVPTNSGDEKKGHSFIWFYPLIFYPMWISFQVENQETSTSGSQVSEPRTSENEFTRSAQSLVRSTSTMSLAEAQRLISLLFALCTKVCLCFLHNWWLEDMLWTLDLLEILMGVFLPCRNPVFFNLYLAITAKPQNLWSRYFCWLQCFCHVVVGTD